MGRVGFSALKLVAIIATFVAFLLTGCATIEKYAPTTERPFCYPKVKYQRAEKHVFVGVSCRF